MSIHGPKFGKKDAPHKFKFSRVHCYNDVPRSGASCGRDECKRKAEAIKASGRIRSGHAPDDRGVRYGRSK